MKVIPIQEGAKAPKPWRWESRHPGLKTDVVSVTHTGSGFDVVACRGQLFLRTDGYVVSMGLSPRKAGTVAFRRAALAATAAFAAGGGVAACAGALPLAAWLGTMACLCALVAGHGGPGVRERLVDVPMGERPASATPVGEVPPEPRTATA